MNGRQKKSRTDVRVFSFSGAIYHYINNYINLYNIIIKYKFLQPSGVQ